MLKADSYLQYLEVLAVSLLDANGTKDIRVTDPLAPKPMAGFDISPINARSEITKQRKCRAATKRPTGKYKPVPLVFLPVQGMIVCLQRTGEYVKQSDYRTLETALAQARAECERPTKERDALAAELAGLRKDSERLKTLRELMGYTQEGSHQTVKIFEDDAAFETCIQAGKKVYYAGSLLSALDVARAALVESKGTNPLVCLPEMP